MDLRLGVTWGGKCFRYDYRNVGAEIFEIRKIRLVGHCVYIYIYISECCEIAYRHSSAVTNCNHFFLVRKESSVMSVRKSIEQPDYFEYRDRYSSLP